jgi:hypothetical protein
MPAPGFGFPRLSLSIWASAYGPAFPELHDRVRRILADPDATDAEIVELLGEVSRSGGPKIGKELPTGPTIEWTTATTVSAWAKVFGVHRNEMGRLLRSQSIRNRRLNAKSFMIAVDDLPAMHKAKFRPASEK